MSALLLVDVQNDFLPPRGSLAVPDGDSIIPHVLQLLDCSFDLVIASQDYHPKDHVSFASAHSGRKPFESISISHPVTREEIIQDLWPDHCVQNTSGAEFEERVSCRLQAWINAGKGKIVRKGEDAGLDAYSAFAKPLKHVQAGSEQRQFLDESPLTVILRDAGIKQLVVVGLATDYCVRATVLSAVAESSARPPEEQWQVYVVRQAVRGVDPNREVATLNELKQHGAHIVDIDGPELKCFLSPDTDDSRM